MTFVNGVWQLHGLTSYGIGCALPGYPGVYTRVSYYINWIKSITQFNEITTITTTKKPTRATTTNRKTSSKKLVFNTVRELVPNVTDYQTTGTNLLPESLS
jgi:secreted trypsin-like serine protease